MELCRVQLVELDNLRRIAWRQVLLKLLVLKSCGHWQARRLHVPRVRRRILAFREDLDVHLFDLSNFLVHQL